MRSAITVSLVPEAAGGPFVFWNGLPDAFARASSWGFEAVEIFPSGSEGVGVGEVRGLMEQHGLGVAAVGTGAGWVKHRLHLCHPEAGVRAEARRFVMGMVRKAGELRAPSILGSMQGRVEAGVDRKQALDWLAEALGEAERVAADFGQFFLYEPLNRYETNLFNRQLEGADFLRERGLSGVRILADWFHMNLEEADPAEALRGLGALLGHVHFADSNRRAVGFGHTDVERLVEALREMGYSGYLSAEILPLPDSETAARQTMESFRRWVRPGMDQPVRASAAKNAE
jgi:sugar phosphate isomerase/epimerase